MALEFHLHAGVYKARSDVGAVIHCHPNWSTVLSTAGVEYLKRALDIRFFPELWELRTQL